ncbi:MAG: hypothetical protein Q9M43_12360 [Sulfurimonas sp.]|nr:hypothetical protein [Sulfurimonas sp.]
MKYFAKIYGYKIDFVYMQNKKYKEGLKVLAPIQTLDKRLKFWLRVFAYESNPPIIIFVI